MRLEQVDLGELAAELGTPLYAYSAARLEARYRGWRDAFAAAGYEGDDHWTCFAVKANGALAVLRHLAERGSGFDIVSRGELARVQAAGVDPGHVVYSGPGKDPESLAAAVAAGVGLINLESPEEAATIARLGASRGEPVPVGLRLNPDLEPGTHPSIATGPGHTKFGLAPAEIASLAGDPKLRGGMEVRGVAVHIGSQITRVEPLVAAARVAVDLGLELADRGHPVEWLDLGGGRGISYDDHESVPSAVELVEALRPTLYRWPGRLVTEPGRVIAGPAGVLLTRVLVVRPRPDRRLVVCDAGMNALLRPALYGARHRVEVAAGADGAPGVCDVVGPLCETGDFLARDVELPPVVSGDLLVVRDVGAYGWVMSSEYNGHPRPPQVWVSGARWATLTPRPSVEDLLADESAAPWQPVPGPTGR